MIASAPASQLAPDMRALGLIGLVLALLVVGWLAKTQVATLTSPPVPASSAPATPAPASVRDQSQQIQQQIRQSLDAASQPRAMPDE